MTPHEHLMKTGGCAFPLPVIKIPNHGVDDSAAITSEVGLTIRDYFAAAALTGILAHKDEYVETAAEVAYKAADAMIEVRKL